MSITLKIWIFAKNFKGRIDVAAHKADGPENRPASSGSVRKDTGPLSIGSPGASF